MQQKLWLRAISRVLLSSSIKPVCVLRAASSSAVPSQLLSRPSASRSPARVTEYSPRLTMSLSNSNHTSAYSMPPARTPNLSRTYNSHHAPSHHHSRDNGIKAEMKRSASADNLTAEANPKASRTHQELHKELLLAHKKGLGGLSSRSELHKVMEKKKKEQNHREEEQQTRGVLGQVLLRRQQQQLEKEKQEEDKTRDEAHLSELVRVRQNLRKIHTAIQSKANS